MNKPVAWIDEETGCFVYSQYDYEDLDEHGKDGLIPLYTHSVKELTELDYAEFLPIWKDFIKDASSILNVQMVAHHFYNLALRKAQEK